MTYNASTTQAYFDQYATREWERLEKTLQGRIKYAIHRRFLERYIRPGMRVLDVGSGPGRFAIDIVRLGARVTLVDLSPVQLDLARARLAEQGVVDGVDGFHQLDILDLLTLEADAYDAVVCFGGAVSYTTVHHRDALRHLARVARPGAPVLVSVMALFGTLRLLAPLDAASVLERCDEHLDWAGTLAGDGVVYTRAGSPEFHQPLALFTAAGLRQAMEETGLRVEAMATANPLIPSFQQIPKIDESPTASAALLELEVALCEQPALLDGGEHLLAVARRPTSG